MKLGDLISKLQVLVTNTPATAEMHVYVEGSEWIHPLQDIGIQKEHDVADQISDRLVNVQPDKQPIVVLLSDGMASGMREDMFDEVDLGGESG